MCGGCDALLFISMVRNTNWKRLKKQTDIVQHRKERRIPTFFGSDKYIHAERVLFTKLNNCFQMTGIS